ncbi:MAG: undecaprenyl-diphosphate phosphatase [Saprospiraceae bacterium]|nr:undecaprenyl-diphosphate phosphatase [Candidatus Defluviibacterium haderslevense]
MTLLQTIIIAIIEGITEFLPISSTGHMILADSLMNIEDPAFVKTFEIAIQLGAISAIVIQYADKLFKSIDIYIKLFIAFIPTAIIGFLAYKIIKLYLFNPLVVAIALILGGIIIIVIDRKMIEKKSSYIHLENISYTNAFFVGLIQCLSMIPGVSRAAATIIGGVYNGFDKKQATEFSFLLAIPTMLAATGYELLKTPVVFTQDHVFKLGIGAIVAFITAWIAVKLFLKIIDQYGFKFFGYYRIVLGVIFLLIVVL